jgi:uracil-DNA glycosylase family 4
MTGAQGVVWDSLSDEIRSCRRCPLGRTRTQAVVYRGGPTPRVVLVGEAPGAEEDRQGLPFVGRSGRRLDEALQRAGLAPDQVGIINLLKCRPPENRFDPAAAATCRPYLDAQLRLLAPELLITLGARALAALDPQAPPVLQCAGRLRSATSPPIFPLLHPAAALHNPLWRGRWEQDLLALGAEIGRRSSILL